MVFIKFGKILVFFVKIRIGLVFGFCGCHFIGIGLVLVCHFPESGISNLHNPFDLRSRSMQMGDKVLHDVTSLRRCPPYEQIDTLAKF